MFTVSTPGLLTISLIMGAVGAALFASAGRVAGFTDLPCERSSHCTPVPKGGGFGILCAFVYVSILYHLPFFFWVPAAILSVVGLAGDRVELSPFLRLAVQFSLAMVMFVAVDGSGYEFPGYLMAAFFWSVFILATANFYNFMDGINGIAGITGVIAFGSAGWIISQGGNSMGFAMASCAIALACAGFLPFNIPVARVFMGDVGSLLLGFLYGGFVCMFSETVSDFAVFVSFMLPFYADAVTTLLFRLRDGENIIEAHRRHLYQLMANELGIPHWKISVLYGGGQIATGLSALAARKSGTGPVLILTAAFFAVFFILSWNLRKRLESRDVPASDLKQQIFSKHIPLVLMTDMLLVMLSLWLACTIRFDSGVPLFITENLKNILPLIVIVKLSVFSYFDLYRGMWRYTSIPDQLNVAKASIFSTLFIVSAVLFIHGFDGFPRSVFVVDCVVTMLLVGLFRFCVRLYYERLNNSFSMDDFSWTTIKAILFPKKCAHKKLLIIGAGNCGEKILREIKNNETVKYQVVGFLDDNPAKIGKKIHGVMVLNSIDFLESSARKVEAEELLIAVPSATASGMKRIVDACERSGLKFKTIPTMAELINGSVTVSAIRDVSFRDLLGRKPVELDQDRVGVCLNGRHILVTGAGGSIGSELCRQICRFKPARLICVDWAETPLFDIDYELKRHFKSVPSEAVLADIQSRNQVERIFAEYSPDVVFHAAAYKHVAMLETQPWKAVINNIFGTLVMAEAARKFRVDRFVLVSTDKAVTPTSIMGASKRIAEIVVQNQHCLEPGDTKFMTVRFGNVAGSAGSVVPLFKKQIREGGPVTVTHPEVTRFFMTIPEACQLILQAGAMGNGREIFILDMGRPIKILEMAKDIIRLYGHEPDVDIKIEFIGLRKGEKLFEELVSEGENVMQTSHESIMVLQSKKCSLESINGSFDKLYDYATRHDERGIVEEFRKIISDYTPSSVIDSYYPPN